MCRTTSTFASGKLLAKQVGESWLLKSIGTAPHPPAAAAPEL